MTKAQKFRQIVGPAARKIKGRLDNEDPDLGPLAQFLWEFYQRYEKQLELNEMLKQSGKRSYQSKNVEGGDDNHG